MKLRQLLDQMLSLSQHLKTSKPLICGGTPRDRYMRHLENISDLDITTGDKTVDYLSQEFAQELGKKYNIMRKSMDDGHSSIYIGSFKMDFSSNFNVPNINSLLNKLNISNPTNLQREMYSRDFTCNALLLSLDLKELTDITKQGFKDINSKIIRTCLSPEITLTSNRNRVVRAIYLAAKLGFDLDPLMMTFIQKHPESIKISTEKALKEKLNEAFVRDADKSSYLLNKLGLWKYVPVTKIMHPYFLKKTNV